MHSITKQFLIASLVLPALLLTATTHGQTGGTLKLINAEATVFDHLVERKGTISEIMTFGNDLKPGDDQILVGVKVEIEGTVAAGAETIQVAANEIVLSSGDTACKALGLYSDFGTAQTKEVKLFMTRPYVDGRPKNMPSKITFTWAFYAPKNSRELKLKVGTLETTMKVPEKVTKIDGGNWISAKVESSKLIDTIETGAGQPAMKNPDGKILQIKCAFTPKKSNDPKGFFFDCSPLNVRVDGKAYGCAGAVVGDIVSGAFNRNYYTKEPFKPQTETVLFMVPADAKEFELLWLGGVVASGKIGK